MFGMMDLSLKSCCLEACLQKLDFQGNSVARATSQIARGDFLGEGLAAAFSILFLGNL
jgi:hypothetical protein